MTEFYVLGELSLSLVLCDVCVSFQSNKQPLFTFKREQHIRFHLTTM